MAIPENPITRKEHFLAKAAGENVNTPDPITREEMYLDAIASGSGGSGGGGSGDNRFVVTCTPTAQDYSGTMDKTAGQILEAYNSGKEIWFAVGGAAFVPSAMVDTTANGKVFCAYAIMARNNILIVMKTTPAISTEDTNNPHNNTYNTTIYQLTPMGG